MRILKHIRYIYTCIIYMYVILTFKFLLGIVAYSRYVSDYHSVSQLGEKSHGIFCRCKLHACVFHTIMNPNELHIRYSTCMLTRRAESKKQNMCDRDSGNCIHVHVQVHVHDFTYKKYQSNKN